MIRAWLGRLFPVKVYHHRSDGPVFIDSDRRYIVVVVGRAR